ncbi:MAG: hypothetical protein KHX45_19595, partial [Clostridiales bacterium]|nr:hypothetical protein [Clostridiales bacterium]
MEEPGRTQGVFENRFPSAGGNESSNRPWRQQVGNTCGTVVYSYCPAGVFLLYRKFLLNHELCKQIALQKQGTENRRLRLEDI